MTGLFGGEGFIMQQPEGDGWVFVHVGGTTVEKILRPVKNLHIDTGCVAAYTGDIDFDLVRAGSVKSMIFGGEGVFLCQAYGPGKSLDTEPAVLPSCRTDACSSSLARRVTR